MLYNVGIMSTGITSRVQRYTKKCKQELIFEKNMG